jgi:hypothetical protein
MNADERGLKHGNNRSTSSIPKMLMRETMARRQLSRVTSEDAALLTAATKAVGVGRYVQEFTDAQFAAFPSPLPGALNLLRADPGFRGVTLG